MPRRLDKTNARTAQRERTRAAILDAAEQAFAEHGYTGARVDAIARSVGIHRASLFHHFPDKPSLYQAVIADRVLPYFEQIEKLLALAEQRGAKDPGLELVVQGVSIQADFFARNPRIARIFLREISDDDPTRDSLLAPLVVPLVSRVKDFLLRKQREGVCDPVDPAHLVTAVAGAALLEVVAEPVLRSADERARPVEERVEEHKRHLAQLVSRLLGLDRAGAHTPGIAEEGNP